MRSIQSRAMILTAAVLWGTIGWFYEQFKSLGFSSPQVVFLRVLCAAVCMTVYMLLTDRSVFRVRVKDMWLFFGSGVVSLAFFNVCYFKAMDRMDLSVAATLLYTAPVFVMILSAILFKESITARKILALVLTVIGCIFVTGALFGSSCSGIGFLYGLGSGIGYALYSIFGVVALKRYRSETITLYTFWLATIGILPFCRPFEMVSLMVANSVTVGLLTIGIGVLCCLLPYLFYTKGLAETPPSEASILATLEPVVAAILGWCFLGEAFSWTSLGGMVLIVGSVILLNIKKRADRL